MFIGKYEKEKEKQKRSRRYERLKKRIDKLPKPTVANVNFPLRWQKKTKGVYFTKNSEKQQVVLQDLFAQGPDCYDKDRYPEGPLKRRLGNSSLRRIRIQITGGSSLLNDDEVLATIDNPKIYFINTKYRRETTDTDDLKKKLNSILQGQQWMLMSLSQRKT